MAGDSPDPYGVLGIPRDASPSDITRAYKRAARTTHPDTHPGDASAADRFRAATAAYETLSDPRRRAAYDRAHRMSDLRRTAPRRGVHLGPLSPIAVDRRAVWAGPVHIAPSPGGTPGPASLEHEVADLLDAVSRRLWARRFPF